VDSELDRTFNPFERNEEFEAMLDARDPDEAAYARWVESQADLRERRLLNRLDLQREEGDF